MWWPTLFSLVICKHNSVSRTMMSDAVRDVSSKWGHVLINIITFRLAENMPACETQRMTPVKINELRNESQTQGLFFSISSSLRCLGPLSFSHMGCCSNTQDGKDFCPSVQFGSFVRGSTQILERERGRWGPVGYLYGSDLIKVIIPKLFYK